MEEEVVVMDSNVSFQASDRMGTAKIPFEQDFRFDNG